MNAQKPEKMLTGDPAELLWVHSMFSTIQGEGPFSGIPAFFVRLAGCNLQCPACDTEYTAHRYFISPHELAELVRKKMGKASLVVVTGGEPCRQPKLAGFVYELADNADMDVQIETNGTLELPYPADKQLIPWGEINVHVVCSPKTGKVHNSIATLGDNMTFKYVLRAGEVAEDDGLPIRALGHPAAPRLARPPAWMLPRDIYINPLDESDAKKNWANLQAAKESCLKFGYRLGIQLHKLIGVE